MDKVFLTVLNLSILASFMVFAVIIVRLLFRKMLKYLRCFLWILVGVRLLIPFSVEAPFSLIHGAAVRDDRISIMGQLAGEQQGEEETGKDVQEIHENHTEYLGASEDKAAVAIKKDNGMEAGMVVWCLGIVAMLGYFGVSLFGLWRKVKMAVPNMFAGVKVYCCDTVSMPFLYGILHPKIYLPLHLEETELFYIVKHEDAHRRRKDYLLKLAAFLVLSVYWFNPCIWVAYKLLCKDIELACDELVIRDLSAEGRKEYSKALLGCSAAGKEVMACPVALGETEVKERVKNVLNYKKPTFSVVALGVIICAVILLCFMTEQKQEKAEEQVEYDIEKFNAAAADFVTQWARAFCGRDGKAISAMYSEEYLSKVGEDAMIPTEENDYAFGWSSPWPWDEDSDFRIWELSENHAEILYYAWVSDPHVFVWRESITYHQEDGKFYVDEQEIENMEDICGTSEKFFKAYPEGKINDTPMDYLKNGAGEILNSHAKENENSEYYSMLFAPDTAAVYLLNLSEDRNKVEVTIDTGSENNKVQVVFRFMDDGSTATVTMIRPYGEDGIWIPQTTVQTI